MGIFDILNMVKAVFRFLEIFGKLILVVGIGIAGLLYSPWFKSAFLGFALGALTLFGLEYTHLFEKTTTDAHYCINPNTVPGGPKKQCWIASDPNDPREMYGHWEACQ
jgi:hypothetical protein